MERPILFSAPMVRSILDDQKTMTRRRAKFIRQDPAGDFRASNWAGGVAGLEESEVPTFAPDYAPHQAGDTLWVREAHSIYNAHGQHRVDGQRWGPWGGLPTTVSPDGSQIAYYREGFDRCDPGRWRPSIHMPRWASRITLRVMGVKVERLQDISDADARAEGIVDGGCLSCGMSEPCECDNPNPCAVDSFVRLWNTINGPNAWSKNPWVVAYTFERVLP